MLSSASLIGTSIFPRDLLDQIFWDLEGDEAALSACSLIGRIWHSAARARRFHTITLNIAHGPDSLHRSLLFAHLLECHPEVGPSVRDLTFSVQFIKWTNHELHGFLEEHAERMMLMPNVRRLTVERSDAWKYLISPAPQTLFSRLKILRLRNVTLGNPLALHGFLHAHPTCQMVRFYRCGVLWHSPVNATRGLVLDTLSIKEHSIVCRSGRMTLAAVLVPGVTLRVRRVE